MNIEQIKTILDNLNLDYKICLDGHILYCGGIYEDARISDSKLNIFTFQKKYYKDDVKSLVIDNKTYFIHILIDITEYIETIFDLKKDSLTGLNNRREMDKYTTDVDRQCVIAILDIDDFKRINDTYGHQYGDLVLKTLGQIIKSSIRKNDFAARYGGEEILIIFNSKNCESVKKRIDDINKKFNEKFKDKNITFSAGLNLFDEEDTIEECIKKADKALYYVKNHGKKDSLIYTSDIDEKK